MMSAEEAISITVTTIQGIIFLVGFYLQIKTFLVVEKERELAWKLYISHGVVILIYYPSCMFMQATATHLLYPLADVTGDWLCHMMSFLKIHGITVMYTHSIAIAIFRFIFVVHRQDVAEWGKRKVEEICFWLIAGLQILISLSLFTNPNTLDVLGHTEYSACFGIAKGKRIGMADYYSCGFGQLPPEGPFGSFINTTTACFCVLETIILLLANCNLPEGYLYYKIFQCIYRYAKLLLLFICALLLSICLYT